MSKMNSQKGDTAKELIVKSFTAISGVFTVQLANLLERPDIVDDKYQLLVDEQKKLGIDFDKLLRRLYTYTFLHFLLTVAVDDELYTSFCARAFNDNDFPLFSFEKKVFEQALKRSDADEHTLKVFEKAWGDYLLHIETTDALSFAKIFAEN